MRPEFKLPPKRINQTPLLASPMHQPVELMDLADWQVWATTNGKGLDCFPTTLRHTMFTLALQLARTALEYVDDGSGEEYEVMDLGSRELDFIDWFVDEVEHPEHYL